MKENRQQRLEWLKKNRPNDPQLAKLRARKQGQPMPGPQPNIITAANPAQPMNPGLKGLAGANVPSPESVGMVRAPDGVNWMDPKTGVQTLMGSAPSGVLPQGFQPAPRGGAPGGPPAMPNPQINGVNNPLKQGQLPHGQTPMWNGVNNPLKLGQQPHGQNPMWNGVNNPLKAQGPMNPAAAAPANPGLEEAARQVALQQVPYRR